MRLSREPFASIQQFVNAISSLTFQQHQQFEWQFFFEHLVHWNLSSHHHRTWPRSSVWEAVEFRAGQSSANTLASRVLDESVLNLDRPPNHAVVLYDGWLFSSRQIEICNYRQPNLLRLICLHLRLVAHLCGHSWQTDVRLSEGDLHHRIQYVGFNFAYHSIGLRVGGAAKVVSRDEQLSRHVGSLLL